MKPHVLPSMLWTVAFAVLFTWLVAYAARGLIEAQHNPVIYHYKKCPSPTQGMPK
jgi:hypothetical protein